MPTHFVEVILRLPALLLGIGFHEFAHAYTAWRLGDPTPKENGRLSLNPVTHMSLLGTLMIFVAPIGWGRAVQVNPANFRDPTRDMLRVAIAGPFMNFFIASLAMVVRALLFGSYWAFDLGDSLWAKNIHELLFNIIVLNAVLGFFNLIPIPPLDGSKVLRAILPGDLAEKYDMYAHSPIVFFVFIALAFSGSLGIVLAPFIYGTIAVAALGIIPAAFSLIVAAICCGLLLHSINATARGEGGARKFSEGIRWVSGLSFILGGLLVVVGSLGMTALLYDANAKRMPKDHQSVTATLIERRGVGTMIETAVLEYVDSDGNKLQVEVPPQMIDERYNPGHQLTMSYYPDKPPDERLGPYVGTMFPYETIIGAGVFGGLFFYLAYKILRR